jgi:site-specific DNA-methyltransferase (adenine-specific)
VLTRTGTLAFELGDSYSGSGGAGGDYDPATGLRAGQPAYKGSSARRTDRVTLPDGRTIQSAGISNGQSRAGRGWPQDKSLCFVPQLFGASLAYGRNLLRPERTIDPWRVRNVVRWVRPNPPVGALGDKFRPATSEMVVACTARDRWFDLDAVRSPLKPGSEIPRSYADGSKTDQENGRARVHNTDGQVSNPAGAPPLDWWEIPTQPYPGSHYATWPEALCVRPILAMCPQHVCTTCGEPRRRIVDAQRREPADDSTRRAKASTYRLNAHDQAPEVGWEFDRTTLGWSDCGHGSFRRGVVLDPFAGSGTTLAVAEGHGRDSIGIDLDARNEHLIRERVGLWLEVA